MLLWMFGCVVCVCMGECVCVECLWGCVCVVCVYESVCGVCVSVWVCVSSHRGQRYVVWRALPIIGFNIFKEASPNYFNGFDKERRDHNKHTHPHKLKHSHTYTHRDTHKHTLTQPTHTDRATPPPKAHSPHTYTLSHISMGIYAENILPECLSNFSSNSIFGVQVT